MGILIEAVTLVVPKWVLSISFEGGEDAFLDAVRQLEPPPRFACATDRHLVNVSFSNQEQLGPALALLATNGVEATHDSRSYEVALVDQESGPIVPCDWLQWRRHEDGFTSAWSTGSEDSPLAAPEGWSPEASLRSRRPDVEEEPERFLRLAAEDGIETWLDLARGALSECLPRGPERSALEDEAAPGVAEALLRVLVEVMTERGWTWSPAGVDSVLARVLLRQGTFDVTVWTNDDTRLVCCVCALPIRIPPPRWGAVLDALNRANIAIGMGNFEMGSGDGSVRFRTAVDVEGGVLTPKMFDNMLRVVLYAAEHYHDAFMRVAYGDVEPAVAIREAEGVAEDEEA